MSSLSSQDNALAQETPAAQRGVRYLLIVWALLALGAVALGAGAWLLWQDRTAATGGTSASALAQAPRPAADFQLTTIDGRTIKLSDLQGQVVLLNFWATWCPPCRAEMPDLEALYREQGPGHKFTVLAVDVEETAAEAQAFAREYGLTFAVAADSAGKVSNDIYGILALPTSFIIDRAGNVRYRWSGGQSRPNMLKMLERVW